MFEWIQPIIRIDSHAFLGSSDISQLYALILMLFLVVQTSAVEIKSFDKCE